MKALIIAAGLYLTFLIISSAQGNPIDSSIGFRHGDFEVSKYILHKNFERHLLVAKQNGNQNLDTHENWWKLFESKLILMAHAYQLEMDDDPILHGRLRAVEEYMLTANHGLLYDELIKSIQPTDSELFEFYTNSLKKVNVRLLKFSNDQEFYEYLGTDFNTLEKADQLIRVMEFQENENQLEYDGWLKWPFIPFSEFESELLSTELPALLKWNIQPESIMATVLLDRVDLEPLEKGDYETFAQFHRQWFRDQYIENRRTKLLKESKFSVEIDISKKEDLTSKLLSNDRHSLVNNIDTLCSYSNGQSTITIRVNEQLEWVSSQFIPTRIDSYNDLIESAKNRVVSELELAEADRLGLKTQLKFKEDRYNYFNFLLLEKYTNSKIKGNITISESDIKSYYIDNIDKYKYPTAIEFDIYSSKHAEHIESIKMNIQNPSTAIKHKKAYESKSVNPARKIIKRSEIDSFADPLKSLIKSLYQNPKNSTIGPIYIDGEYLLYNVVSITDYTYTKLEDIKVEVSESVMLEKLNLAIINHADEIALSNRKDSDIYIYRK